MSLFGKVPETFAENWVTSKVGDALSTLSDSNVDKQLEESLTAELLNSYGNETFYNDLDKFLIQYNVMGNLIGSARGINNTQPIVREEFIQANIRRFSLSYPQYKGLPHQYSQICGILGEIFDHIIPCINALNPHTDGGKLQNSLVQVGRESAFRDEKNHELLLEVREAQHKLLQILQAQPCNGTGIIQHEFTNCSNEIALFTEDIKKIELEYQQQGYFEEALSQYLGLLQSIATKLRNQPSEAVDALICSLNCNIALCQSNLDEAEKALKSLSEIPATVSDSSKAYHFVYAAVIIQHRLVSQYNAAARHLDRALAIDDSYHRAFLLAQYLYALMDGADYTSIIKKLDSHFASILESDKDTSLIADFYMYRGAIYQFSGDPFAAEDNYRKALARGSDPAITKFNLIAAKYGQATIKLSARRATLFPELDIQKMLEVKDELEQYFGDAVLEEKLLRHIKENAVSLYVSACAMLGLMHNLSPLEKYLPLAQDYAAKRALILGYRKELPADIAAQLEDADQLYLRLRGLLHREQFSECKQELEKELCRANGKMSPELLLILLQVCLVLKLPEEYWKYREVAIICGANSLPFDSFDAYAYELNGNISQAKTLYDHISDTSRQYSSLENALRFYSHNNYLPECEQLYFRVHRLYEERAIVIDDPASFYQGAILFLVDNHCSTADKFFYAINPAHLSDHCYYQLKAILSQATNNVPQLLDSSDHLYEITHSFQSNYNRAFCHRWLSDYDTALEMSLASLDQCSTEEEKVSLYWFISDAFLLKNNLDESYRWAKKAHDLTSKNPYAQSHAAFLGRAIRTNHQEGLPDIIEYKHTHPIVIDWLHEFSIGENDNPLEAIKQQLEKNFPCQQSRRELEQELLTQYQKGMIPLSVLLKLYNGDWQQIFQFARNHSLYISHGNLQRIQQECQFISDHIVVDAQTLLILSHYKCLPVLQHVKHIHIPFSTVATLQQQHLSWNTLCIQSLLDWLRTADNIIYEADGFISSNELLNIFPRDFLAGCNIAHREHYPFLYTDAFIVAFQELANQWAFQDIDFVSIPALCNLNLVGKKVQNQMVYNLLTGCRFISFSAETILDQIVSHDFNISADYLKPFLICRSDYDMDSFSRVYLLTIASLKRTHTNAAISFAKIILDDTFRIWRKGIYYRENRIHLQAHERANRISNYVRNILGGIEELFPDDAKTWEQYSKLNYAYSDQHSR